MAALKRFLFGFALVNAAPAAAETADPVSRWSVEIAEASLRFGVPIDWIARVMRTESGGMTMLRGRPITSRAGATGLMQLMPRTWAEMRSKLGLGRDPHDPRDNILAGTAYLRAMYDRFGYPGMFAAYNAGPARYAASLRSRRTLPRETQIYVATITGAPAALPSSQQQPVSQVLFVALQPKSVPHSSLSDADQESDRLFAISPNQW